MLAYRPRYYSSLTKLILMDNVPGRLEMFLMPFSGTLQRLQNADLNTQQGIVREKEIISSRLIV